MQFGVWTRIILIILILINNTNTNRMGPRKHVLHWGAHSRNLANAIEPPVCSRDAAFLWNYFDHLLLLGGQALNKRLKNDVFWCRSDVVLVTNEGPLAAAWSGRTSALNQWGVQQPSQTAICQVDCLPRWLTSHCRNRGVSVLRTPAVIALIWRINRSSNIRDHCLWRRGNSFSNA